MNEIKPPKSGSPNRFIDCQDAIETKLRSIVNEAVEAGWGDKETLAAVIEVAENLLLGEETNYDVLRQIRRMT